MIQIAFFCRVAASSNCVLKPTAGEMVVQNQSASARCGLARRYICDRNTCQDQL